MGNEFNFLRERERASDRFCEGGGGEVSAGEERLSCGGEMWPSVPFRDLVPDTRTGAH